MSHHLHNVKNRKGIKYRLKLKKKLEKIIGSELFSNLVYVSILFQFSSSIISN